MHAVGAVIDGQFDTGKKPNAFLSSAIAEGLVLAHVEFVVIGDDADTDIGGLERLHVCAGEAIVITSVGELLVRFRMEVKVGPHPFGAVLKNLGSALRRFCNSAHSWPQWSSAPEPSCRGRRFGCKRHHI